VSYHVTVSARFEAAHNLIDYKRGPEPLHGHSYKVEIVLETPELPRGDLAVDFIEAQKAVDAVAKEFDYKYINEHPAFAGRNTSAENLARYFAEKVADCRAIGSARVAEVTAWEGPENRATYVPQGKARPI